MTGHRAPYLAGTPVHAPFTDRFTSVIQHPSVTSSRSDCDDTNLSRARGEVHHVEGCPHTGGRLLCADKRHESFVGADVLADDRTAPCDSEPCSAAIDVGSRMRRPPHDRPDLPAQGPGRRGAPTPRPDRDPQASRSPARAAPQDANRRNTSPVPTRLRHARTQPLPRSARATPSAPRRSERSDRPPRRMYRARSHAA